MIILPPSVPDYINEHWKTADRLSDDPMMNRYCQDIETMAEVIWDYMDKLEKSEKEVESLDEQIRDHLSEIAHLKANED